MVLRLWLAAALALATLAACAEAPISPRLEEQAVPVGFSELKADPGRYQGQTVILGGQIVKTEPTPKGTVIDVLQTRTDGGGRPQGADTSEGQFVAVGKGFLDPQVYAPGRKVTVAGRVAGMRTERVGGAEQVYPLIEAEEVHLWPQPEPGRGGAYGPGPITPQPYGASGSWKTPPGQGEQEEGYGAGDGS